jgi:galactose mutarotase-like enzyme
LSTLVIGVVFFDFFAKKRLKISLAFRVFESFILQRQRGFMSLTLQDNHESAIRKILLDSGRVHAVFLPEIGFKLSSLVDKATGKELMYQPVSGQHPIPAYRGRFVDYQASGCDEMLPTVDECIYDSPSYRGRSLPDHGGVWSRPWSVHLEGRIVQGHIRLLELPLLFEKRINWIDDSSLEFNYSITNEGDVPADFLWALHPLCVYQKDAKLLLPRSVKQMFNVHQYGEREQLLPFPRQNSLEKVNWNVCELGEYEDKKCYKFYTQGQNEGRAGIWYRTEKLVFLIEYDPVATPYLGVWINCGAPEVQGDYNVAIEPANAFYDSLSVAQRRGTAVTLESGEKKSWRLVLRVLDEASIDMKQFA